MSEDSFLSDQDQEAAADRACLELRDQVARAQRVVDRAREFLSRNTADQDEARPAH